MPKSNRDKPYVMAFDHEYYDVQTHEGVLDGQKKTIIKFPTTIQAWMQLRSLVDHIAKDIFDEDN